MVALSINKLESVQATPFKKHLLFDESQVRAKQPDVDRHLLIHNCSVEHVVSDAPRHVTIVFPLQFLPTNVCIPEETTEVVDAATGCFVDATGGCVDGTGCCVDATGGCVDATGCCVDATGCCVDATVDG